MDPIPPGYQRRDALDTTIQNFPDKPNLANWTPKYKSIEDLHTTTQNLADEPTLANGPPITIGYQRIDALNTTIHY